MVTTTTGNTEQTTDNTEHLFAVSTETGDEEEYAGLRLARTRSPGLKDNTGYSSVSDEEEIFSLFMNTESGSEASTGPMDTTSEYSSDPGDVTSDPSSDFDDLSHYTEIKILPRPALFISASNVEGKLTIRDSISYSSNTSHLSEVFIPMEDEAIQGRKILLTPKETEGNSQSILKKSRYGRNRLNKRDHSNITE